jgi:hypothetical protein
VEGKGVKRTEVERSCLPTEGEISLSYQGNLFWKQINLPSDFLHWEKLREINFSLKGIPVLPAKGNQKIKENPFLITYLLPFFQQE